MIKTLPLDFIIVFLIGLLSASFGKKTFKLLSYNFSTQTEEFLFSLGLGLFVFSHFIFGLGLAGLLYKEVFYLLFIILMILLRKEFSETIGNIPKFFVKFRWTNFTDLEKALIVVMFIAVIGNLLFSYVPPLPGDELTYQISLPKLYADSHQIVDRPDIWCSYFPMSIHMLYTLGILLGSPIIPRLMNYLICITLTFAMGCFTKRFIGRRYGVLSAAIFYTLPFTTSHNGITASEFAMFFYGILGIWSFFIWLEKDAFSKRYIYLTAIFLGAALTTRPYYPIGGVAACFLLVLYCQLFLKKNNITNILEEMAICGGIVVVILSPWLIKNYFFIGNPLYPKAFFPGQPTDEYFIAWSKAPPMYIGLLQIYRTLIDASFINGTGPLLSAFIPCLVFLKNVDRSIKFLLLIAVLGIILTLAIFPYATSRYLGFSIPLLVIICAYSIVRLLEIELISKKIILFSLFLIIIFPSLTLCLYFGLQRVPVFLGIESRETYLLRKYEHEGYRTVEYINKHIPKNEVILFLGLTFSHQFYYPNHKVIGTSAFPPIFYSQEDIHLALKDKNVKYIMLLKKLTKQIGENVFFSDTLLPESVKGIKEPHFKLLYENEKAKIYKIQ